MKRTIGTTLLAATLCVGIVGCTQDEPTMAPLPQELPDRPVLDSVPDDATYVQTSTGMGGFTYPLKKGQPYYIVDLDADRVIKEGVAERDGDLEVKDGKITFDGESMFDGVMEGGRRIGLFVKGDLQPVGD